MSNYESFESFSRAVKEKMESVYEADVDMDKLALEKTDGQQVGFQRDDLYRFMLVLPNDEDWVPSKLYAYLPEEIDMIADRPGIPVVEIENVDVLEVIEAVDEKAPEYQGKFEYE